MRTTRLPALTLAALLAACGGDPGPAAIEITDLQPKSGMALTLVNIDVGDGHSCGVASTGGQIWCWGRNTYGELGDGTRIDRLVPTLVVAPLTFTTMSIEGASNCAVSTTQEAWCWGNNAAGSVATGFADQLSPARVNIPTAISQVRAGEGVSCALTTAGEVWCWGSIGIHSPGLTDRRTPLKVSGANVFQSLDSGREGCAILSGTRWCVGSLIGSTFSWNLASAPMPNGIVEAPGGCGRTAAGQILCEGYNREGELGNGTTSNVPNFEYLPITSGLSFVQLATGTVHRCARTGAGQIWCWGGNNEGQIGNGTNAIATLHLQVNGIPAAVDLKIGGSTSCIRTASNEIWCWGGNYYGQLGDGTTTHRSTPVKVLVP